MNLSFTTQYKRREPHCHVLCPAGLPYIPGLGISKASFPLCFWTVYFSSPKKHRTCWMAYISALLLPSTFSTAQHQSKIMTRAGWLPPPFQKKKKKINHHEGLRILNKRSLLPANSSFFFFLLKFLPPYFYDSPFSQAPYHHHHHSHT